MSTFGDIGDNANEVRDTATIPCPDERTSKLWFSESVEDEDAAVEYAQRLLMDTTSDEDDVSNNNGDTLEPEEFFGSGVSSGGVGETRETSLHDKNEFVSTYDKANWVDDPDGSYPNYGGFSKIKGIQNLFMCSKSIPSHIVSQKQHW